jgi:dTDP-D-glucose 4,6-dehydratase
LILNWSRSINAVLIVREFPYRKSDPGASIKTTDEFYTGWLFCSAGKYGGHNSNDAGRAYWSGLDETARATFRFLHGSTDEVYGDLAWLLYEAIDNSLVWK